MAAKTTTGNVAASRRELALQLAVELRKGNLRGNPLSCVAVATIFEEYMAKGWPSAMKKTGEVAPEILNVFVKKASVPDHDLPGISEIMKGK